jgi:hypothetical protein
VPAVRMRLLLSVKPGPPRGWRLFDRTQRSWLSSGDRSSSHRQSDQLRLLSFLLPVQRHAERRPHPGRQSDNRMLFRSHLGPHELRGVRQDVQRRRLVRPQRVHADLFVVRGAERRLRKLRRLLREARKGLRGRLWPVGDRIPSLVGPRIGQLWRQHLLVVRHLLAEPGWVHRGSLLLLGLGPGGVPRSHRHPRATAAMYAPVSRSAQFSSHGYLPCERGDAGDDRDDESLSAGSSMRFC